MHKSRVLLSLIALAASLYLGSALRWIIYIGLDLENVLSWPLDVGSRGDELAYVGSGTISLPFPVPASLKVFLTCIVLVFVFQYLAKNLTFAISQQFIRIFSYTYLCIALIDVAFDLTGSSVDWAVESSVSIKDYAYNDYIYLLQSLKGFAFLLHGTLAYIVASYAVTRLEKRPATDGETNSKPEPESESTKKPTRKNQRSKSST